jgi:acyl-CoA thioester hydrolase
MGAPGGIATLIARQSIEYLHPVPYRHRPLDVQLWIGSIGGASLDVCYEVHGPEGTEESAIVYARADATIVLVDVASGRPVRIGEEARGAWEPYLEEPVAFSRR